MPVFDRRNFLRSLPALAALPATPRFLYNTAPGGSGTNRFKISLNAYSFNAPLTAGKATLDQVVDFCAAKGFDAVDLTGYYFPGYPQIPPDDYVYHLKKKTHQLGLSISGTGIRNDFVQDSKAGRAADEAMVKKWIGVAARLGAPVIRIYTGKTLEDEQQRGRITGQVAEHISACVAWGKAHGVIVAIQNHNDFIRTADQAIGLIKEVNSEWFGLVLDTGSFVTNEPYSEIAKAAPYAVNWQIKEKLTFNGESGDMDLNRLCRIIYDSSYRGFLPIETLSPGDPFQLVPPFLRQVKKRLQG